MNLNQTSHTGLPQPEPASQLDIANVGLTESISGLLAKVEYLEQRLGRGGVLNDAIPGGPTDDGPQKAAAHAPLIGALGTHAHRVASAADRLEVLLNRLCL